MFDPSDACVKDLEGISKQNADELLPLLIPASLTVWDQLPQEALAEDPTSGHWSRGCRLKQKHLCSENTSSNSNSPVIATLWSGGSRDRVALLMQWPHGTGSSKWRGGFLTRQPASWSQKGQLDAQWPGFFVWLGSYSWKFKLEVAFSAFSLIL